MKDDSQRRPELLAPAGDEECLRAAVGAGADAVYFGLAEGFNARAKAANFPVSELDRVFDFLHRRAVRGFVTLNTLVFADELDEAARLLTAVAKAGADAVIVQDLAVARLARQIAPTLPVHASTQMTVGTPGAAALAAEAGACRIVLPRELSIPEIARFRAAWDLELECFVHGALCVSVSGQCQASAARGGRSANRGTCAQPCRLSRELYVDGRPFATGPERYLLSPRDLAAHDLVSALVRAGVDSFKIEGRYKGPEYVAGAVTAYRKVVGAACEGRSEPLDAQAQEALALTFGRGFSHGWLAGPDHRTLVHGLFPGHRGLPVGTVVRVSGRAVIVRTDARAPAVKAGDWMVFDQGDPEGDEPEGGVFAAETRPDGLELRFGDPGPDLRRVRAGQTVWKSHDSALKRRLLAAAKAERGLPVDLRVEARAGAPLAVAATDAAGRRARVESETVCEPAQSKPLDEAILRDKLGAFGGTAFELRTLQADLDGALALPPAELKRLRRRVVEQLEAQPMPSRAHEIFPSDPGILHPSSFILHPSEHPSSLEVVALCRTPAQMEALVEGGVAEIILDLPDLPDAAMLARIRDRGIRAAVATLRFAKAGEEGLERRIEALRPDAVHVRHAGALRHFAGKGFALHGDASLNAANPVAASFLLSHGLRTLAPAAELDAARLAALARALPPGRTEAVLFRHAPLFHTQYCLFAHHLSKGRDRTDCGRPCDTRSLAVRDAGRDGAPDPVVADAACRNTVFESRPRSAAAAVPALLAAGVRRFRLEFADETAAEAAAVHRLADDLVAGRITAARFLRDTGALAAPAAPAS